MPPLLFRCVFWPERWYVNGFFDHVLAAPRYNEILSSVYIYYVSSFHSTPRVLIMSNC